MIRGYSKQDMDNMDFPASQYSFLEGPGEGAATLVMKQWGKQNVLICYFNTDDGKKLKLCVWFCRNASRTYRPRHSDLDLSYIGLNSRLHISYDVNESGKSRFLNAELL